ELPFNSRVDQDRSGQPTDGATAIDVERHLFEISFILDPKGSDQAKRKGIFKILRIGEGLNSPQSKLIRDGGDLTNPEADEHSRCLDKWREYPQERPGIARGDVSRRLPVEIQPNCIRPRVRCKANVIWRGDTTNLDPGHGAIIVFCFCANWC